MINQIDLVQPFEDNNESFDHLMLPPASRVLLRRDERKEEPNEENKEEVKEENKEEELV